MSWLLIPRIALVSASGATPTMAGMPSYERGRCYPIGGVFQAQSTIEPRPRRRIVGAQCWVETERPSQSIRAITIFTSGAPVAIRRGQRDDRASPAFSFSTIRRRPACPARSQAVLGTSGCKLYGSGRTMNVEATRQKAIPDAATELVVTHYSRQRGGLLRRNGRAAFFGGALQGES